MQDDDSRRIGERLASSAGGMRRVRRAGVALALLVTACTTVGPDYERPQTEVPQSWMEARDERLSTVAPEYRDWWRAFDDPVLDRLVENAYRQNLPLRIAGIRVLEARARLGIAVGNLYPQVQQGRAGAIYGNGSENNANTQFADLEFTTYDIGIDAAWEIDFWGKFRRGIESSDASLLASIADYDDLLVSLTAQVANAYVLIRTFETRLEIARNNVAVQRRSYEIADVRFRNGATTELDVQQALTLLKTTEAIIPPLEVGLRQSQNALSNLLGMPPGDLRSLLAGSDGIPAPPPQVAMGMPADLLRRRPDVRRAELQAVAQGALIGVAEADLYPSIALLGTIGLEATGGTNTTATGNSGISELFTGDSVAFFGGPRLAWNIFNYGRIKNNVRVQDARFQQLLVGYQDTVLRAAREVEDATVAFLRSQEQVGFLEESVNAASRSVDLSLIQYRDGAADYTRVLQSQTALTDLQDQLTATRGNIASNLIAIYTALGGGWQLREGDDFVPEATKVEMRERTDWGGLLAPEALDVPPPGEKSLFRRPDF